MYLHPQKVHLCTQLSANQEDLYGLLGLVRWSAGIKSSTDDNMWQQVNAQNPL